jgi:hypothetical protein
MDTITNGQLSHTSLRTNIDDNRKVLTKKILINEAFRFVMRALTPLIPGIHYAILYMLQSGDYILSSEFIVAYTKMDLHEVSELWNIIHYPTSTTIQMVKSLLFLQRSYSPDTRTRYFNDRYNTVGMEQQTITRTDIAKSFSNSINRANEIIKLCRAHPRPAQTRPPQHFDTEIVPLPHSLDDEYIIRDNYDDSANNDDGDSDSNDGDSIDSDSRICPPTLQEMLVIVAETRRRIENNKRKLSLRRSQHTSANTSSHNSSTSNHIAPAPSSSSSNYVAPAAPSSSTSANVRNLSVHDINAMFSTQNAGVP